MVEVKELPDKQMLVMSTPKRLATYYVERNKTGYSQFVFRLDKGPLPEELSGVYSSLLSAKRAFLDYEKSLAKSCTVKRKEISEEREVRNAKVRPEST
jgi:hypothetical protein